MKDEKKLNEQSKEEIVAEKYIGEKSYSDESLHDELEKLAETFRQELKKAQEMSEEEFEEAYVDEEGIIPDEELCACCGEKRRDKTFGKNYEYCKVCREMMRKYPLNFQGVLTAIVMIALAIVSVVNFSLDFDGYRYTYEAKEYRSDKKLFSAIDMYDAALYAFSEKEITPKKVFLECAELEYEVMTDGTSSMAYVCTLIEQAISETEAKLPMYKDVMDMYYQSQVFYGTMDKFYEILESEDYANYKPGEDDEMYKKIMAKIDGILEEKVTVLSVNSETSQMVASNETIVDFCKYMFAYASQEYEESLEYMYKIREKEPTLYWLYAYDLGVAELQRGNSKMARTLADEILSQNIQNFDGYLLHSSIDRMNGRYEKAVEWADEGLSNNENNAELYRMKAMALCAEGEYKKAKEAIDKTMELQSYGVACMTAIVIENELGNTDRVEELKKELKTDEIELTERVQDYLDGKLTARKIFTEGTGDV